jgi:hypothetical protein
MKCTDSDYEFQSILSANLYYCITADQTFFFSSLLWIFVVLIVIGSQEVSHPFFLPAKVL